MAKSSNRKAKTVPIERLSGWERWHIQPELLTDPDGNQYTPNQLRAVWLAWQRLSAQQQRINTLRAQLTAALSAQPKCARPWQLRRLTRKHPQPVQLTLIPDTRP